MLFRSLRARNIDGQIRVIPVENIRSVDWLAPHEVGLDWFETVADHEFTVDVAEYLDTFPVSMPEMLVALARVVDAPDRTGR